MSRKSYATDPTPEQISLVGPLLPHECDIGRGRPWDCSDVLNAILYTVRSGTAWRLMPTVYRYFRGSKLSGVWQLIHDHLVVKVRVQEGRTPEPSAAIIDSQSVELPDEGKDAHTTLARRSPGESASSWSIPWG